jgi:hypothetical protein
MNNRAEKLADQMQVNPNSGNNQNGGIKVDHNPINNPKPWVNQNPYMQKLQKQTSNDPNTGGQMNIQADYKLSSYQPSLMKTQNSQDLVRNSSLPSIPNNGNGQTSGG